MSEIIGYKCDICGDMIETGVHLSGNRMQVIEGARRKYAYRFDICDSCFARIKLDIERHKQQGGTKW